MSRTAKLSMKRTAVLRDIAASGVAPALIQKLGLSLEAAMFGSIVTSSYCALEWTCIHLVRVSFSRDANCPFASHL